MLKGLFSPSLSSSTFRTCANAERTTVTQKREDSLLAKEETLARRSEERSQAFLFLKKYMNN